MTQKTTHPPDAYGLEKINRPQLAWAFPDMAELWQYRQLALQMSARELRVRYKQTVLGVLWAIINPLITTFIFMIVFKRIANIDTGTVPYYLFVLAGLTPWGLFARGVGTSGVSVVADAELIRKIYFPRLITPLSKLFTGLVDFLLTLALFLTLLVLSGTHIELKILFLIPYTLLTFAFALGLSLWLSAIHVSLRDIGYVIPYALQMGLYLTPIPYPVTGLEEPIRTLYGLNPMATVVEGFRWATVGGVELHAPSILLSLVMTTLLLFSGLLFFNRLQANFPDRI